MFLAYRQSWRTHPGFNILFLCAMAAAWGIFNCLLDGVQTTLPWGSNQANVLVFVVAALCLIFIFGTPRYGFKPTAVHYAIMAVTLLPSLPNGQEIIRQSGIFF